MPDSLKRATVDLAFPAIVVAEARGGQKSWAARPLLVPGMVEGVGSRFERALQNLQQLSADLVRHRELEEDDLRKLWWLRYAPELETREFRVAVAGSRAQWLDVRASWWEEQGRRFVVLPGFEGRMFVAEKGDAGRWPMQEIVEDAVARLLREGRRGRDRNPPDPSAHASAPSDVLTVARTTASVQNARFPFEEEDEPGFAAAAAPDSTVDGAKETQALCRDLVTLWPDDLGRAWFADADVERVRAAVFGPRPAPTALVGPPGCGKTTLLHEALHRELSLLGAGALDRHARVWLLDPNRLIAGMRVIGAWQRRFEAILGFLRDRLRLHHGLPGSDVLFIRNPVALFRIGRSSQNDLTMADVLKPWLERREVTLLLECGPAEWKRVQELDRGFADLFQTVRVEEPAPERAMRMIGRHRAEYERRTGRPVSNTALLHLVELQRAWPRGRAMPGAVLDALGRVASTDGKEITVRDVDLAFRRATGLRKPFLDPAEPLTEEAVRSALASRVVGQRPALQGLEDAAHLLRSRLGPRERPLASFLFVGPTGVGKTEAARALAGLLLSSDEAFVRLDMNEFVDGGAVARLIGDFHRPDGILTSRVRRRPFCVLLLDEIEKAHPTVHDLLLQLLGEGRLTDSLGRTTDFTGAVVILTSNLGTRESGRSLGFGIPGDSRAAAFRKAVEDFFRPEFVNRIDRIVAFDPLSLPDVREIARRLLSRLVHREGFTRRMTFLAVEDQVLESVAERGFDPEFGGRALKRTLERDLAWQAADALSTLDPGTPALLEITAAAGNARPRVVPLPFTTIQVEPFEPRPGKEGLRGFIEKLGETVIGIGARIREARETCAPDRRAEWTTLRDAARRLAGELDAATWRAPESSAIPAFRLHDPDGDPGGQKARLSDRNSMEDLRSFLEDAYRRHAVRGEHAAAVAAASAARVAWLDLQARALADDDRGAVLDVRSLVPGEGAASVDWLVQAWQVALGPLSRTGSLSGAAGPSAAEDLRVARPSHARAILTVPLPGAHALLAAEEGVHLFITTWSTPVPLAVRILPLPPDPAVTSPPPPLPSPAHILRVYTENREGGTIADLRTGTGTRLAVDPPRWFGWMYAALPAARRLEFPR